jgi:hypothetical protein
MVAMMAAKMGAKTIAVKSAGVVEVQEAPVVAESVVMEVEIETVVVEVGIESVEVEGFGGISGIEEEVVEVEMCGDVEGGGEVEVEVASKPVNPFGGMSLVAQMAAKMGAKTKPVKSARVVEVEVEVEVWEAPVLAESVVVEVEIETVEVEVEAGVGGFGGISGIEEEVVE